MSQSQESLTVQLSKLHQHAIHEGLYDAAEWMRRAWQRSLDDATVPPGASAYKLLLESSPRTTVKTPQPEREGRTS